MIPTHSDISGIRLFVKDYVDFTCKTSQAADEVPNASGEHADRATSSRQQGAQYADNSRTESRN